MIKATDRCLIIEDNFVIYLDIEEMVTSAGFKFVDQATNSTQVRDSLHHHNYRIALLDLRLGSVDNYEIIHILNEYEIPFAITSTYRLEGEAGAILGGVPIVQKPYAINSVNQTIRQLLMFPAPN